MNTILKTLFSFTGRLNRWRYFKYNFFINLIAKGLWLLIIGLAMTEIPQFIFGACVIFYIAYLVTSVIAHISIAFRRLHDINKSGIYLLIELCVIIPIIGPIIVLIFMLYILFMPGTVDDNDYGKDPLSLL